MTAAERSLTGRASHGKAGAPACEEVFQVFDGNLSPLLHVHLRVTGPIRKIPKPIVLSRGDTEECAVLSRTPLNMAKPETQRRCCQALRLNRNGRSLAAVANRISARFAFFIGLFQ